MKTQQHALLDALKRARHFLVANAALLADVDFTAAWKWLDDIVTSFSRHALEQDDCDRRARIETASQHQLRLRLRLEQMEPISVIARHSLRNVPEFRSLRMPKPARGRVFVASVRDMADAASVHVDAFCAHGLPSTFLAELEAGMALLESSEIARETSRVQRIGATRALAVDEKNARTVLSVLDGLVQQALNHNEPLLRAWQAARLVRRNAADTTTPAAAA